jgi:hypothetical protein
MGDVYRLASKVLAWLGPEENDSNFAMDLLSVYGSKVVVELSHNNPILKSSEEGKTEPHWADRDKPLPYDTERHYSALKMLLGRTFFSRLWIRQEIYLGGDRVQLVVGDHSIPWKLFAGAVMCISWKSPHTDLGDKIQKLYSGISSEVEQISTFFFNNNWRFSELRT